MVGFGQFALIDQIGQVQPTLLILDITRQKSIQRRRWVGVFVGGQKAGQAGFLQADGPGLGQVVGCAGVLVGAGIFAQDEARPVECAGQYPARLQAVTFGLLHFHMPPLLPQGGTGQGGHQCHGEHGQQQGRATLG